MTIKEVLASLVEEKGREKLAQVLRSTDDKDLDERLERIAKAAVSEYVEMFLGRQMPTRANEVKERRLFHLLKCYFQDRLPTEAEILVMFQLTESAATRLLRDVRVKYRADFEAEIENSIRKTLESATPYYQDYRVVIRSESILEELKQVVAVEAPELDQVAKVKNSAGVYEIKQDTFKILCSHFKVDKKKIDKASSRRKGRKP